MKHLKKFKINETLNEKQEVMSHRDDMKENIETLDNLILEISRVRDLLKNVKKGPLKTNYLNMMINFYAKLASLGFDHKDETK